MVQDAPLSYVRFGSLLRHLRQSARLSQDQFGFAVGYSRAHVSRLENDERPPNAEIVRARFIAALGLERESVWAARLVELANAARGEPPVEPVSSQAGASNNLPVLLTTFIGRECELAELLGLLPAARMLTLIGAGGVGKTRLAIEVGRAVCADAAHRAAVAPDGVWLVELAPQLEPAQVGRCVATALGVREKPRASLATVLREELKDRRLLLILDNCEQVVEACAQFADGLLRAGEGVRVLATSRVALGIGGELAWRVPSLRAPDLHQPVAVDELAAYEAVRLLVDRARLARPGFKLTAGNAEAVRQICARLDGIPLALELAAARLGALSAEEIAGRLDDCFRLLTGGGQTVLPRHRTLRASIDWSHQLLTEPERILMRRLSVFAGGWTLASAEAVCGDQGGRDPAQLAAAGGLPASGVLEALAGLVDKSLAVMAEAGGVSRYTMSESIRQYAQERLRAGGEDERLRARHAAHFMELAESACSEPGGHSYALFRRLEWEHANVRAALAWCWSASGDPIVGLRLAAAAAWVWTFRRWLSMAPTAWPEMRGLLEEALAKAPDAPTAVRVEAIECLADLLLHLGEAARAAKLYEEALAWRRQNAGARKLAATLEALANTLVAAAPHDRAALTRAVALYQESLDLYRELGATPQVESALAYLGYLWMSLGEFRQAFPLLDEALTGWRALGVKWSPEGGVARTTLWLGRTLYALGDMARSQALIEESLALYREIQDKNGVGWAQVYLGDLALMRGNARLAARRYRSALTMLGAIDDRPGMAAALAGLFETCRAQGRFLLAARLIGAAAAIGAGAAEMAGRSERLCYDRSIAAARALLDAPGFAAAWAQGQAMSVEQAAACAEEASQPLASRLS